MTHQLLILISTCTDNPPPTGWTVEFDLTGGDSTGIYVQGASGTYTSSGLSITGENWFVTASVASGDITTRLLSVEVLCTQSGIIYSGSNMSVSGTTELNPIVSGTYDWVVTGSPLATTVITPFFVPVSGQLTHNNPGGVFRPSDDTVVISKFILKGDGTAPHR